MDGSVVDGQTADAGSTIVEVPSGATDDELTALVHSRVGSTIVWDAMGTDSESAYEIIQGEVVVEGDISLGPVSDALERHAYLIRNPAHIEAPRDKALIDGRNRRRWNTTVIEVKIEDDSALDNFTAAEVDEIRKAIRMWNERVNLTGIRLREVDALTFGREAITIRNDNINKSHCRSEVGRHVRPTRVRLGPSCFEDGGSTVAHELGHALGLRHEMERHDRPEHMHFSADLTSSKLSQFSENTGRNAHIVGRYDPQSVMQYPTGGFAARFNQPLSDSRVYAANLLTRQYFSRLDFSMRPTVGIPSSTVPVVVFSTRSHLPSTRIAGSFIHMGDDAFACDVDLDQITDLCAFSRSTSSVYWSSHGMSAWTVVETENPIASAEQARAIRFLHSARNVPNPVANYDRPQVISGVGTTILRVFEPVSHTIDIVEFDKIIADIEVSPRGVLIVLEGGQARIFTLSCDSGVSCVPSQEFDATFPSDITPVGTWNSNEDDALVGFLDGELSILRPPYGAWERLLPSDMNLPEGRDSLDEVHIGYIDQARDSDPHLDVLTYRSRSSGDSTISWPVLYGDVDSTQPLVSDMSFEGLEAKDFSRNVTVGYFSLFDNATREQMSALTPGYVIRRTQNAGSISNFVAYSDAGAIGNYERLGGTLRRVHLTDKYPLHMNDSQDISIYTADSFVRPWYWDPSPAPRTFTLGRRSSTDLYACYMSERGVGSLRLVVQRLELGEWRDTTEEIRDFGSDRSVCFDYTLRPDRNGGVWRVQIHPLDDVEPAANTATWIFRSSLSGLCGDGLLDSDEACDDGNSVPNDSCDRCRLTANCGDGVFTPNSTEECDDGNSNDGDGCSRDCRFEPARTCGDGVLERHEFCEVGAVERPCRSCRSGCGDGILDVAIREECDDNNLVAGDGCDEICRVEY